MDFCRADGNGELTLESKLLLLRHMYSSRVLYTVVILQSAVCYNLLTQLNHESSERHKIRHDLHFIYTAIL